MLRAVGARGSAELSTQKQPKKTNLVIDPSPNKSPKKELNLLKLFL